MGPALDVRAHLGRRSRAACAGPVCWGWGLLAPELLAVAWVDAAWRRAALRWARSSNPPTAAACLASSVLCIECLWCLAWGKAYAAQLMELWQCTGEPSTGAVTLRCMQSRPAAWLSVPAAQLVHHR